MIISRAGQEAPTMTTSSSTSTFPVSSEYVQLAWNWRSHALLLLFFAIIPPLHPAVRLPTSMSSQSGAEFGRITFEFETVCSADCELYFMMVGEADGVLIPPSLLLNECNE